MSARDIWDGRPVTFATLSIRDGDPIIDLFARSDGKLGRYTLLAATMRWADTGDLVFANADEIYAQPLTIWTTIMRLSNKAMFVNGLQDQDPDAPPAITNGHDAQGPASPPS